MRRILARQRPDGTFPQVGMNDRMLCDYRQGWRVLQTAREFGQGAVVQVEEYGNGLYRDPTRVYCVAATGLPFDPRPTYAHSQPVRSLDQ
jgi:hypothetical protein